MPNDASSAGAPVVEKRLRLAGLLICLGLLALLLSLIKVHPLSFVAFAMITCPLVLAGIVLFLYSIVSHEPHGGNIPPKS
ncbi:MAG TPA: hypothetical protein VMT20_05210 [Terriglobia bacterium]|nr:hypothetical protein [Terriglobia bacterium]